MDWSAARPGQPGTGQRPQPVADALVRELLRIAGERELPAASPRGMAEVLRASPRTLTPVGACVMVLEARPVLRRYWQYEARIAAAIVAAGRDRQDTTPLAQRIMIVHLRRQQHRPGASRCRARRAVEAIPAADRRAGYWQSHDSRSHPVLFAEYFAANDERAAHPARRPTGKAAARGRISRENWRSCLPTADRHAARGRCRAKPAPCTACSGWRRARSISPTPRPVADR
jgi:hypothetical protein